MRRLLGRASLVFGSYVGVILAVVVAGYLGEARGIWAAVLWGAALIAAVAALIRRRLAP